MIGLQYDHLDIRQFEFIEQYLSKGQHQHGTNSPSRNLKYKTISNNPHLACFDRLVDRNIKKLPQHTKLAIEQSHQHSVVAPLDYSIETRLDQRMWIGPGYSISNHHYQSTVADNAASHTLL